MNNEYTKNLEDIIKNMLRPLKDVPLKLVIEAISNFKILKFDPNDPKDKKVLEILIKVADKAGSEVNKNGIKRPRPNEVGNDIETHVKGALNHFGYKADIPTSASGKKKAAGYPDIEFIDEFNRYNYLECKTYNIQNINTT